jgi:hypothetical protein
LFVPPGLTALFTHSADCVLYYSYKEQPSFPIQHSQTGLSKQAHRIICEVRTECVWILCRLSLIFNTAVSYIRRVIAGLSPLKSTPDTSMWDLWWTVTLHNLCLRTLVVYCQYQFYESSTVICILILLLPEAQVGDVWELFFRISRSIGHKICLQTVTDIVIYTCTKLHNKELCN